MSVTVTDLDLLESPLPVLFKAAESIVAEAEHLPSNSETTQDQISRALAMLKQCRSRVDSLGLFSANDEVEDISTADLKYLLVDFYCGDLAGRTAVREPRERLAALAQAAGFLRAFLSKCDRLMIAGPEVKVLLEREEGAKVDPNTLRNEKIMRFKREKQLRERLAEVQRLIDAASAPRVRRGGGADGGGEGGVLSGREEEGEEVVGVAGAVDEETVRELYLTRLQHACVKAVDMLGSLSQELEILKHAARNPGPPPAPLNPLQQPQVPRDLSILRQLASAANHLRDREAARAQVFRPGHQLPSMSLQELAEREVAEARGREERQAAAEMDRRRKQERHDEWGDDEDIIRKERAWDDFKDDNPYGHGNSAVRPLR